MEHISLLISGAALVAACLALAHARRASRGVDALLERMPPEHDFTPEERAAYTKSCAEKVFQQLYSSRVSRAGKPASGA